MPNFTPQAARRWAETRRAISDTLLIEMASDNTEREQTMTQWPIKVVAEFNANTDHFKQDLREFFTRSNFYLAVQAALLSVFGVRDTSANCFDYVVMFGLILTGLALSAFWALAAYGSVRWIGRWREEVRRLSREYSETKSYDRIEALVDEHPLQSAERITMYLPWLFSTIWCVFGIAVLVRYAASTGLIRDLWG